MAKSKKIVIGVVLTGILCLVLIHFRTPFFQPKGGDWSVGFGFSDAAIADVKPRRDQVISPTDLQKSEKNTKFLADPFFIKEKDSFYLFFEHKHFNPFKADISVMASADGKKYHYKGKVLEEKFHLSYPQVFRHQGKMYMLPETGAAGHVLLYASDNFPYGWKIADTLFKGRFKDPSIYLSDTLSIMVASDDNLSMHLFTADSLHGKWARKHRVLMGSEARPGGRIFESGGSLYLPVQDCSKGYGSSLSLYRFDFSKKETQLVKVKEEFLKAVPEMREFSYGMHHYDVQKVDGRHYYVYDGNNIDGDEKIPTIYYALKLSLYDFLSLF
ncbi:glucosamine inositolphosphorylceramide transferase family protein [Flavobacterium selenitireducens]|uniref:glucosamine inositolphosphorylceramide transferase family protein n=1 Tax=Flavobacterium selenitireducens TaxID=2722704 RepID=UPI00168AFFF2|nr:hypothetical protein [Flavobacterium selenitireducens]MBD3583427.1 hypothetical protein [Flavobacterium selenitireducens]